jgi:hypothetical protein
MVFSFCFSLITDNNAGTADGCTVVKVRYCATDLKVAGSIPDGVIGILN